MLLLSSHLETGHYFNRHAEPEPGLPGSRRDPPTASAVPALRGRGGPDLPATIPEVREFQAWYSVAGHTPVTTWEKATCRAGDIVADREKLLRHDR